MRSPKCAVLRRCRHALDQRQTAAQPPCPADARLQSVTSLSRALGRFGALVLLPMAGCNDSDERRVAVEPFSVQIADDGTTVMVAVSWPVDGVEGCPPNPAGLDIEVTGEIGNIAAYVSAADTGSSCQAECGELWQSVTLDQTVGNDVRWEWSSDARAGCSPSPLR